MANSERGYGKRPIWQWILIYAIVGGIIYAVVYFLFLNNNNGYNYTNTTNPQQQNQPEY